MKGIIKFCCDFVPLIIFFIFYKKSGNILDAIIPLILTTIVAIILLYILEKRIPIMPTFGCIIISIFGGLSLYFQNQIFIYMKPTIVNIIFAGILFVGNIYNKPLLKYLMNNAISLDDEGWFEISKRWIMFFIFLACINEIVWRFFSENTWVNFKVFGIISLTFIFTISLFPLIKKHQKHS